VNLLSDEEHPTQALADLLTIRQCFGRLAGLRVAFVGDGNNVARSLAYACALAGARFAIASPHGFELGDADVATSQRLGGVLERFARPAEAAAGADVLYTDVWISMGEEPGADAKRQQFAGFTVDDELLKIASPDAIVLHCLPAHRGEEITAAVIDGPRSRVWQQAENRMHAIRGILALLFGAAP
jgi:ornithine carbamoyltransferase